MCTLANSEDTDEMPHSTAFHQGHLLFAKKKKKYNFISKIKTFEPLLHWKQIVCLPEFYQIP